jgi:hypothetical protein
MGNSFQLPRIQEQQAISELVIKNHAEIHREAAYFDWQIGGLGATPLRLGSTDLPLVRAYPFVFLQA